ncbi:MAG: hypothetical protein ACI3WR_04490 [Oscillospiraceae bacterium]
MMRSINRLNEEIARWAFEILFKTDTSWHIAFTNPTAGPWKTMKAVSLKSGEEGEVYRFILEEDRPDIVMYNDDLRAVIIFEAKDSLQKLREEKQAKKSAAVVVKLAGILRAKDGNSFWKGRETYRIVLGLLWGSTERPETEAEKEELFDYYHSLAEGKAAVYPELIVGVETLYRGGALRCSAFCKSYDEAAASWGGEIVRSLVKS